MTSPKKIDVLMPSDLRMEIIHTLKLLVGRIEGYRKLGVIGGADAHASTKDACKLLEKLEVKVSVPTDKEIIDYVERENPLRCPMCGGYKLEVVYTEWQDDEGKTFTGDKYRCWECGGQGEYE